MSSSKDWWYIIPVVGIAGIIMTGGLGLSKKARFPGGIDNNGNCLNFDHKQVANWSPSKGRLDVTINLCPGTHIDFRPGAGRFEVTHLPRTGEQTATPFYTTTFCNEARPSNDPDLIYCTMLYGAAVISAPGSYDKIDKWPAGLRVRVIME